MRALLLGLLTFLCSHLAVGKTLYTFNGGGTEGNWTDRTIWTTDPTGSTGINQSVPANGDNVFVTNSFTVYVTGAISTTGLSITVQKGGVLDLQTAASTFATLSSLAGQGTLRIGAPYFPTVTTNNFGAANTGTVEFYNWPAGPTALPPGQYNNLRLLNSTATAYVVQLDNDLTLNGGLTLIRTNANGPVTFNLGKAATARTLNVLGDITIGAGTFLGVSAVTLPITPATTNPVAPAAQTFHTINASGNFINNGTVNLHNGTTNDAQAALLNFTGNTNNNFACNGPTDLDILQINKGADSQVTLNITSTVNPLNANGNLRLNDLTDGNDLLSLINGVVKLGNNITLPKIHNGNTAGTGFTIGTPDTNPTLWIAGATLQNNNANGTAVYGTYRISAGRYENLTPDAMVVRETGQVLIEGGETYVDRFRPSNTSSIHRGSFIITGGIFYCKGTSSAPRNPDYARFSIPLLTQSFRMTGGVIQVENPLNAPGMFHIGVNPNNAIVTGGTINIILPASNTNAAILTTSPLWNLNITKVGTTGTSKALLDAITVPSTFAGASTSTAQPLTVLNNFTISNLTLNNVLYTAATFDASNATSSQNIIIQGTLTVGSGSVYRTGTNTTTFSGGQDQLLVNNGTISNSTAATLPTAGVGATGTGTFNNWTVNKSAGTLTLGGSVGTYYTPSTATLSLLNGVLNDGGKTINVQGSLINSASHSSGGGAGSIVLNGAGGQTISGDGTGVFGNLKLRSTAAAGAIAATLTANMSVANTLTMLSNNILAIGANRLSLTNVDSNSKTGALVLGPGNSFSTSCFIQTAGNQSDLGLQKTYGKGDSFDFPVGTGLGNTARYAPATITLALASSAPLDKFGQVSVSPTNRRNPFIKGTTNSLAYYWKVRSVGFGPISPGSVSEFFTMTNADATGTLDNYVPGRYQPVAWTPYSSSGMTIGASGVSSIGINAIDAFDGEFTAGEPTAFGPITSFYSRGNGAWNAATTWSTAGFNGTAAGTVPGSGNPVFIGSASSGIYHTVNVTANTANSGSLVIDRGSTLDVASTTGHNFGALPDAKVGGSGRLRVSSSAATATFPGGDFGSFIQYGGGTVEYYTSGTSFTVPAISSTATLTLNQYRNLWLNAATGRTITLPNQDLRVYAQLKTGVANGATTFPGTVLVSAAAAGNLRADSLLAVQAGIFRYQNTTARALTVDTDVRVDNGATFDVNTTGTVVANSLTIGGSLLNNGTVDFKKVNAATPPVVTGSVDLTFLGSQNANLTSAGTLTDLYSLTVNKGLGRAALLTFDGSGVLTTPANNWLTLTNGTLNYTKPVTAPLVIHDASATPYLITDNAGLTVNAAGGTVTIATANNAAADLKLAGQLQVLQGTLQVGAAGNVGNDLEYASAGAPGLNVTGGTLYVNGQIRRTVANLDGALRFDQSGGAIDIDGQGAAAAQNNERGLFEVQGKGSIFRMSGGTLTLHRSNQKSPILTADLYLAPDSTVVTAGTVVLGNAAAGVGPVTISVNSTVPLYDLRVEAGANNTNQNIGLLTGVIPLSLKGSLTIGNDNSFFNANGLGLNLDQQLNNNNSSTNIGLTGIGSGGGFWPGTSTQTTTFTGKGPVVQQLTSTAANLTTFGSLVLNNAQPGGTLQLGANARVAGTLTLTKGTLNDNGKTITVLGDVLNSATHASSGSGSLILAGPANQNVGGNNKGRFGNLTLNNAAGATTSADQEVTSVLNLAGGVLTIGSNLLNLSNPAAGAVTGFSAARFIRTNGIVADLGVRKSYPAGALNFTFPVGAAAKYTPVVLNVTANAAAGTLTVQPIDLAHPSTTDPASPATPNKLSFYWKVSSTLASPTVTMQYTYGVDDIIGTETTYKLGRFYNGTWTPLGGIASSLVNVATHTLSVTGFTGTKDVNSTNNTIEGDYTGGDPTEFATVLAYYSRNATAGQPGGAVWTNATTWTYNADGTDSAPLPPTPPAQANPVVIRAGHLVTAGSAGRAAASLSLLGTLDLGSFGANNFSTITGTGTLRIGSALFPAGNYSAFVAATGGTVDYSGAVQLPARDTYNNLTFSGGNTKQLSNLDLTINGALAVNSGTVVNNSTNQSITLNSTTSGATVSGTLNQGDGALTTGAFLATTGTGTLNLGAGLTSIGTTLTNGGTLNNGTGDVTVGTAFSNGGTYNANLGSGKLTVGTTFTNSGNYTAGVGKLTVGGDFTNASTGSFTVATGEIATAGSFANAGSYGVPDGFLGNYYLRVAGNFSNLATGLFSAQGSTVVLQGNFSNSNGLNFDAGNSLVQLVTDANRTLTGATTFFDVQKVGAANLFLNPNTNVAVGNVLTMRGGLLVTGTSNILSLTNTALQPIVGADTTSYVAGRLAMSLPNEAASIRVFPVGLGGRYRPVTITPRTASTTPVVLVEIFNGAPAGPIDNTLSNISANRYYRIQLTKGTIGQPTVQLSFNTNVIDEKVKVPGNLRVAFSNGPNGPWSTAGGAGVFSPSLPRGYTISAQVKGDGVSPFIDGNSFFALASTNIVDNPLTGTPPVPLPVKLVQFAAVRQGATVRVSWATASEQNSAYFVVQRSADGRSFADVQRVAAQGISASRHDYATLDAQPLAGLSYYRLHQVDTDGKDDYSPVVAVRFEGAQATPALVAYPNPAPKQGFQLLTTNLGTAGGTVQVFDNVGRLVLTHVAAAGAAEATIQPTQPLASGLYFVTWQTADGLKLTTKVAVE